jgi:predicted ATPase
VCRRHGFAYYLAMGNIVTGWALAAEGEAAGGLQQLREGLDGLRALGAELRLPYYFALLAETLGRAGMPGEALAALSNGFAFASKNGEQWPIAELYRVQGELLNAQGNRAAAQESFERGVEAARRAGSLAFERKLSPGAGGTAISASSERF